MEIECCCNHIEAVNGIVCVYAAALPCIPEINSYQQEQQQQIEQAEYI
jgi:hypothetical protein